MEPSNPGDAHRSFQPNRSLSPPPETPLLNVVDAEHLDANPGYQQPPLRESCERLKPAGEKALQRFNAMATELHTQAMTPFLREHVPGTYAPVEKPKRLEKAKNNQYCYRHSPTSGYRKPADETKMTMMQKELDKLSPTDRLAVSNVWSIYAASPAPIRSLLLHGILESSCFPQLSLLSREVHEQLKIDFLAALPSEVSLQILRLLDSESLCKAVQVSRRWKTLADDDAVWFHLCEQHVDRRCTKCGWGLPLLERQKLRDWKKRQALAKQQHEQRQAEVPDTTLVLGNKRELILAEDNRKRRCTNGVGSTIWGGGQTQSRSWKSVYRERFMVGVNWRHGRCTVKTLKVHRNGVTCLAFGEQDNVILSGSYDNTVVVSDIKTASTIRTLTGHTMGIRCLEVSGNKVFSGSLDSSIKVWNCETGTCLSTLRGHTQGVLSLDYDEELQILVSGSMDHTVKVFCFDRAETFCLRGHSDWVNDVKIHRESNTVWTASDDTTMRVFDLQTNTCIKIFEGHLGQVQQILFMPPEFEPNEESETASVSCGHGNTQPLSAHATCTSEHTPIFDGEESTRRLPAYIFSASLDNTLKLWCTASSKCIRTTFGHVEGIWSLSGDSLNLASGSHDSTVKIWEPKSGVCQTTYGGHSGPVSAVISDDTKLISAGEDGTIIVRSFQTDEPLLMESDRPST